MPEDFGNLRRLLALKRHEQPPPGYFDKFSRGVVLRLQSGGASEETFMERLQEEAPWLGWLLESLRAKPLWSGVAGAAACALVLGAVAWMQNLDIAPASPQAILHPVLSQPEDQTAFVFNASLTEPSSAITTNASGLDFPSSLFSGPGIAPQRVQGSPDSLFRR